MFWFIPTNTAMVNTIRALSVSTLILLASCLPAAEPVDNDSACSSSWKTWDEAWWTWDPAEHTTTAVLTTEVLEPGFDFDVPYTTLCDGYRRAVVSRTTTPTVTYNPPMTTTFDQSFPDPKPTCTIGDAACTAMFSSYSSVSSVWANGDLQGSHSPIEPHCTTSKYQPCDSPEYPGNHYCFIEGQMQVVWYWPVSTKDGDFCTKSGKTIFAKPTSPPKPNTVVKDGHTFTSPTAYVSFGHLEANLHIQRAPRIAPSCGGTSYDGVIIPVTGAMTTKGLDGERSSFNLEDLNTMKYEDFKAQRRCKNNPCTVIEDFYTPELALPTEVLKLQPKEWKAAGCRGTDIGTSYYHPRMVPLVTPAPVSKGKLL
jgi:hypothetical protein